MSGHACLHECRITDQYVLLCMHSLFMKLCDDLIADTCSCNLETIAMEFGLFQPALNCDKAALMRGI